jgi:iron complex transport system ATP-binding protein
MIQLLDLSVGYRPGRKKQKTICNHITQQLHAGELVCLLGPNGSGKSTLLRTLSGFLPPLSGEILLNGRPLHTCPNAERARRIGLVLTDKTFAGSISVFDLVALGRHPYTGFFGRLTENDRAIVSASLQKAGIAHQSAARLHELSDGERQKAMIAKTLAQNAELILLDEPTAFLDLNSRIETTALLKTLANEERKTILMSTHDLELACRIADRFWLLSDSRPLVSGTPAELMSSGTIDRYFHLSDSPAGQKHPYLLS